MAATRYLNMDAIRVRHFATYKVQARTSKLIKCTQDVVHTSGNLTFHITIGSLLCVKMKLHLLLDKRLEHSKEYCKGILVANPTDAIFFILL